MKAQLDYSITVNCPNCGQAVELHTDSYYTEQIDNKVFNNKWDDVKCEVLCMECDHKFMIEGVEC